jgi:hypothetical protein
LPSLAPTVPFDQAFALLFLRGYLAFLCGSSYSGEFLDASGYRGTRHFFYQLLFDVMKKPTEPTPAAPEVREPTEAELIERRNAALREAGIVDLRTATPTEDDDSDVN